MTSSDLAARIEAGTRAVLARADLVHRDFGRAESRWKGDGTRVTATDIAVSEGIFDDLAARFPGDQLFSEELSDPGRPIPVTARFSWILDPIDGTNNFALGIPQCAISLGLVEDGVPAYGIVYDIGRRTLMRGGPGFGMRDGDREARVAPGPLHPESLVGFQNPYDKELLPMAMGVLEHAKIRCLGSASLHLAYVAAGILDGLLDFNVKIWDLAAAIALCRGAGGDVAFLNGEQLPIRQFDLRMKRIVYVAGSPAIRARLEELAGRDRR
jgi:myo-inositol-1(or 4)-monophosphatase